MSEIGVYTFGEGGNRAGGYIFDDSNIAKWIMGPTGELRPIVHNNREGHDENGMVFSKSYIDDDSYYAPYLVCEIGKRIGLDVPRTEIDNVSYKNPYTKKRYDFTRSSIVYDSDKFGKGTPPYCCAPRYEYVHPEVIEETYFLNQPNIKAERSKTPIRTVQQMVSDYVESTMFYLTTRGSKECGEYTNEELDEMKQKLIDRLLFGLRFGIKGVSEIKLQDNSNAQLDSYYLASDNMLFLHDPEVWAKKYVEMSDEEFQKLLDRTDTYEYTNLAFEQGDGQPTSRDIIKCVYENYPEQAPKFYKRLEKLTENDLEAILGKCEKMSFNHKVLALRTFKVRGQIYDQIHQQHIKTQEDTPTVPVGVDR